MRRSKTFADRVEEYVDSPRLRQRIKSGRTLCCIVDGHNGTYRTCVTFDLKRLKEADCTCPSELWPCKHINALALTYQQAPETFLNADGVLAELESKPPEELLQLIREMILAAPASLQALGFVEVEEDEIYD